MAFPSSDFTPFERVLFALKDNPDLQRDVLREQREVERQELWDDWQWQEDQRADRLVGDDES